LIPDNPVHDDKLKLPDRAWPPTGWYADWVSGLYVFDIVVNESPIGMQWLVYQKAEYRVFTRELKNGTYYLQHGNSLRYVPGSLGGRLNATNAC
jgi:hypothetical protein